MAEEHDTQPDAAAEPQAAAPAAEPQRPREQEDEFGIDQKRMTFGQHLSELRMRILVCVVTVGIAFFVFFFGFRFQLYALLYRPVRVAAESAARAVAEATGRQVEVRLFSLKPYSMFATSAYICVVAAIALTIPVTLYELWAFVAPGLKRRERAAVKPVLLFGSFFFILGMVFAYTQVVPAALRFLIRDTARFEGVELRFNVSDTLKFETVLLLVFGCAFEMPVILVTLTRLGVVSPEMIARHRRIAILLMFIAGALLTPPDVITQLMLAGPLVVLFEISIQAAKFFRPQGGRTIWEPWDETQFADTSTGEAKPALPPSEGPRQIEAPTPAEPAHAAQPDATPGGPRADADREDEYDPYAYDEDTYQDEWSEDQYEDYAGETPYDALERLRKQLRRKRPRRPRGRRRRH